MALFQDGAAQGIISGNVNTALVGKDPCFNLPIGKVGTEWEGNILMHGLECL